MSTKFYNLVLKNSEIEDQTFGLIKNEISEILSW